MGNASRTKTDAALRARAEAVAGTDPRRAEVLQLARVFKASWIDLGEALTAVRRERAWEGWGYASFEEYCRRELSLTPATADKLTGGYAFLASRAPELTRRARRVRGDDDEDGDAEYGEAPAGGPGTLPSYQAVDFWRRAEEAGHADDGTLGQLGEAVLAGESPARLARRFNPLAFPQSDADRAERARAAALAAAQRLADSLVDCDGVPRALVKELESSLGRLVEILRRKDRERAA